MLFMIRAKRSIDLLQFLATSINNDLFLISLICFIPCAPELGQCDAFTDTCILMSFFFGICSIFWIET